MTNPLLTLIAENRAAAAFLESHLAETPIETLRLEGMGMALAKWTEWTGEDLVKILLAALGDANFHEWVESIEKATGVECP